MEVRKNETVSSETSVKRKRELNLTEGADKTKFAQGTLIKFHLQKESNCASIGMKEMLHRNDEWGFLNSDTGSGRDQ